MAQSRHGIQPISVFSPLKAQTESEKKDPFYALSSQRKSQISYDETHLNSPMDSRLNDHDKMNQHEEPMKKNKTIIEEEEDGELHEEKSD